MRRERRCSIFNQAGTAYLDARRLSWPGFLNLNKSENIVVYYQKWLYYPEKNTIFSRDFVSFQKQTVFLSLVRVEKDYRFSYPRTRDDIEIDLIIERPGLPTVLIEIKSTDRADERDAAALSLIKKRF